jgi:hypothetical protein
MRILFSTFIAIFVSFVFFLIIKIWGQSQTHVDYKHPFFQTSQKTMLFKYANPSYFKSPETEAFDGYYLNVAMSEDQKLIVVNPDHEIEKGIENKKQIKFQNITLAELQDGSADAAILFSNIAPQLKNKKIIFNFLDNPLQLIKVFLDAMAAAGLESGDQFIFISGYEPPAKTLKEDKPAYLFGSTQPEILRIKAMESLYLIEAATFRADVIIYPLKYYGRTFFTETLITEIKRRHKKFIVGPIADEELNAALALEPLAVIIK